MFLLLSLLGCPKSTPVEAAASEEMTAEEAAEFINSPEALQALEELAAEVEAEPMETADPALVAQLREDGLTLVLIEAGTAPAERRLSPAMGSSVKFRMTTSQNMVMDLGMGPTPVPIEPIIMDFTNDVIALTDDTFTVRTVFTDVKTTGPAAELLATMNGLEGHTVIDFSGYTQDLVWKNLDTIDPTMAAEMEADTNDDSVPLPKKAFGVGAIWETRGIRNAGGLDYVQLSRYTVTGIDSDTLAFDVTVSGLPVSDEWTPPGMGPGISAELLAFSVNGSGSGTTSLEGLELQSTMNTTVGMDYAVTAMGQRQEASVTTDAVVAIETL